MVDLIQGPAVVIDNGSGSCKAGFAGDHVPKIVFPSKVGHPRPRFVNDPDLKLKNFYVGDEAVANRGLLHLKNPVEQGLITNWDDMEKLWDYTFTRLDVCPDDHPVLLTDIQHNPLASREKMAQIIFETFKSPAIYIAIQGVLALYAYGLVTGVAVDIGTDITQIVPVVEGFSIPDAARSLPLGGHDLSRYLMKLLAENGKILPSQHYIEDVREIKERLCYVALDFDKEMKMAAERPASGTAYQLPDDTVITIRSERFRCPEALFQPSLLGKQLNGIHKSCFDSVTKCDELEEITRELYANIVLSGGSSVFPGFRERMQNELTSLAPSHLEANVMAVSSRKHNVWIGGSIIASQSVFQEMWLTRTEYQECGPSIIHKKCV